VLPWLAALSGVAAWAGDGEGAAPVAAARAAAQPLVGGDADYDGLVAMIGDARVVMLGESTHGSREFYRERARLTRRLMAERGFTALVLEAPWEPTRRLDAYVGGTGRDADAAAALAGFSHFPRWSWRNREIRQILEDLRAANVGRPPAARWRLFGMDLYSLPQSADAVVRHRARQSVALAERARQRFACFDRHRLVPDYYGVDVAAGRLAPCAEGAAAELAELEAQADAEEDAFSARQSARVVVAAERYYRTVYGRTAPEGERPWNIRERYLADTLDRILAHLGPAARIVVWAHNSHQGDARETDQGAVGELSIGQLMRERHGDAVRLVGFTTYAGTVRAASGWGRADRVWRLRPARPGSWPALLHQTGLPAFLLVFRGQPALAEAFSAARLDRAVGVTYRPDAEMANHYYHTRPGRQFDALVHLDRTSALEPLPD
jgi:erythromycin esterase-like protein